MSDGRVLARGTVLVDPRKAVEKLRAHQLAQPGLYVLEVVRAATLMGATALTLENDSDDLALSWTGAAPASDSLRDLLDHLFDANDRALRLLAVAVNAALGLDPAFVDLYTTAHPELAPTQAARLRYTARGAPLGQCSLELVERPKSLGPSGFMLHVRERFGTAVMAEWLRREPAETSLLRARLLAPRISVARGGDPLRAAAPELVATANLEPLAGVTGALHLLADTRRPASLTLCELGVLLERRDLQSSALSAARRARFPDAALPLQLAVDADALDTNISRSQVDLARGLGAALRRRWPGALAALVRDALAEIVTQDLDAPRRRAGEESLLALVLWAHGERWTEAALREQSDPAPEVLEPGALHDAMLAPLFDAPLLPTPFGARVSLRDLAGSRGQWAAWTDDDPLPQDLAPWLRDVVWCPPARPVLRALLSCVSMRNGARAHAEARESSKRLRTLMAHPPQPVRLGDTAGALLRAEIADADLHGELAVLPRGRSSPGVSATVFLEGRPFCALDLGACEVVLRAAVQSPRLSPRPTFDGVIDDEGVRIVRRALMQRFVDAVGEALARGTLSAVSAGARAELTRAAWTEARALSDDAAAARAALRELCLARPALFECPAWTTTDERHVSTRELVASALVPPRAALTGDPRSGARADGREVLCLNPRERRCLEALLDDEVRWIDHRPYLPLRRSEHPGAIATTSLQRSDFTWLTLHGDGARLSVSPAPTGKSTLTLLHAGVVVSTRSRAERLGPSVIALEDDALIPFDDSSALPSPPAVALLDRAEQLLASALCDALLGDAAARASLNWSAEPARTAAARRFLLVALGRLQLATGDAAALRLRIESVPLIPRWSGGEGLRAVSPAAARDELNRSGARGLSFLVEPPAGLDGEEFAAFILPNRDMQQLVAAALQATPVSAEATLRTVRAARARRLARQRLLAHSPERLDATLHGAAPHTLPPEQGAAVAWAFAPTPSDAQVRVLTANALALINPDGPPGAPLVVRVALDDDGHFGEEYRKLTREGSSLVDAQVQRALTAAAELAVRQAESGQGLELPARRALYAWLTEAGRAAKKNPTLPLQRLCDAPLWTLTTGERAALGAARDDDGAVRVVVGWMSPWIRPAPGEAPDPPTLSLLDQADLDAVRALARKVRDLSADARKLQRRRAFARGDALAVRLPGEPLAPWATARFEDAPGARGKGELRLARRAAGAEVSVFDDGAIIARTRLDVPVAVDLAFASPDLDPSDIPGSLRTLRVAATATHLARSMLRALLESRAQTPGWLERAIRWHLCTAAERSEYERHVPVFTDTAGAPISLRDMEIQRERFELVAWVPAPPEAPVSPRDALRRVVVLDRDDAAALSAWLPLVDHSDALAEDLAAWQWQRTPPARGIVVPDPPPHLLRRSLDPQRDGVEGEVILLRGDAPDESTLFWFHHRRPLGHTPVASPWPCRIALDAPGLTPRPDHRAPIDDDARAHALNLARAAIARTLDQALAPPPESALATVRVHEGRSPAISGGVPLAAGTLWLTRDALPGTLVVEAGGERHELPARLPPGRANDVKQHAPISGRLWLRKGAGARRENWEPLVWKLVAWSWRRLLDAWIEERTVDLTDEVTLAHLLHAGLAHQLGGASAELARRATLPGGELSVSRAAAFVKQGKAITVRPADAPPARDAVVRRASRWFSLLQDAGGLRPETSEVPAPQGPARAVDATSAPPSTPLAASTRAEDLAEVVLARLRALDISRSALREIRVAPQGDGVEVCYERRGRTVYLDPRTPWVRTALEAPERCCDLVAVAVLGELNRALDEVTDAHEESALRRMLAELAGR